MTKRAGNARARSVRGDSAERLTILRCARFFNPKNSFDRLAAISRTSPHARYSVILAMVGKLRQRSASARPHFSRVTSRSLFPTFHVAGFLAVRHDEERVVKTAYTPQLFFCFSQHSGRNAQSFHRQDYFCTCGRFAL